MLLKKSGGTFFCWWTFFDVIFDGFIIVNVSGNPVRGVTQCLNKEDCLGANRICYRNITMTDGVCTCREGYKEAMHSSIRCLNMDDEECESDLDCSTFKVCAKSTTEKTEHSASNSNDAQQLPKHVMTNDFSPPSSSTSSKLSKIKLLIHYFYGFKEKRTKRCQFPREVSFSNSESRKSSSMSHIKRKIVENEDDTIQSVDDFGDVGDAYTESNRVVSEMDKKSTDAMLNHFLNWHVHTFPISSFTHSSSSSSNDGDGGHGHSHHNIQGGHSLYNRAKLMEDAMLVMFLFTLVLILFVVHKVSCFKIVRASTVLFDSAATASSSSTGSTSRTLVQTITLPSSSSSRSRSRRTTARSSLSRHCGGGNGNSRHTSRRHRGGSTSSRGMSPAPPPPYQFSTEQPCLDQRRRVRTTLADEQLTHDDHDIELSEIHDVITTSTTIATTSASINNDNAITTPPPSYNDALLQTNNSRTSVTETDNVRDQSNSQTTTAHNNNLKITI